MYHKSRSYDVWLLRYEVQHRIFFIILGHIFALLPPNSPKNENIKKKMKNMTGDIIILHKCTKNHHHMLYCSWNMAHDGCNCYFHIGLYFSLKTPLTAQKNENFKIMKNRSGDITILQKCTKNHDHKLHYSWDMARVRCNHHFSFWAIFCPFTPLINPSENFKKMKKMPGDIII